MDPIKLNPPSPTQPADPAAVRALLEAGAGLAKPHAHPMPGGSPYAVIPPGWDLQELPPPYQPTRPVAKVTLDDVDSFVNYWTLHHMGASRIYATLQPPKFVAVLDDFIPTGADDADCHAPWREFRASFQPAYSREWQTWTTRNRKPMTQLEFAEFVQDNLPDVAEPDGATLLETALNFEASQSGSFVSTQRLNDGSHNLQWKTDNNASGTVLLPQMLVLQIPVFDAGDIVRMEARLRYRVIPGEGKLILWYELVRPHKAEEAALREMWKHIEEQSGREVLMGRPE